MAVEDFLDALGGEPLKGIEFHIDPSGFVTVACLDCDWDFGGRQKEALHSARVHRDHYHPEPLKTWVNMALS